MSETLSRETEAPYALELEDLDVVYRVRGSDRQVIRGVTLNVKRGDLERVLALLPALQRPTISPLSDADWVAVNTIIEERTVRDLIPRLKASGGQGIVEYPLNKIVV